ncbi:hypothetical protein LTR78_008400 [Recurvomyces mirabilis]|uniref:Uncharacterized protein n=1 Tax=Recurvomyces mirabilis TaxID=574656 RepID=A0AAE0TQY3_9PEZI|nr:hypothetical protein LTR78_008400 [Recurvomyces mirabilis]KAK5155387.1 hypothetical protein LTS14_005648 [Recurvomyces mirabilis]
MASEYLDHDEDTSSNFSSMRDSMYLLATLNQYSINGDVLKINRQGSKAAEGLLRVTLFSKDLRLLKRQYVLDELHHAQPVLEPQVASTLSSSQAIFADFDHSADAEGRLEPDEELNSMRQRLARQLRETRRKGVVPVFVSTMWFLFALAISIQSSFGLLGQDAVAHDLALGLLLSWLPIVILCSIVDRNPVSADDIRKKLNRLVDHVRQSLMDEDICRRFVLTIDDVKQRKQMRHDIAKLSLACGSMKGAQFFEKFAGQGRQKWHYGAAHGILCDIEDAYIAESGRHWLRDEKRARTYLVLGDIRGGLDWLDYRELQQVVVAVVCVEATTFGAWIVSYFTPTVGLGCRSFGYTVFGTIAFGLLVIEIGLWWWWDAQKNELKQLGRRATSVGLDGTRLAGPRAAVRRAWVAGLEWTCVGFMQFARAILPRPAVVKMVDRWHALAARLTALGARLTALTPQQRWDRLFFKPVELTNTAWLTYRMLAQTFGSDNTCECMSSIYAGGGGYIDLSQWSVVSNGQYVRYYWATGTTISVMITGLAMSYIVLEWCLQSHLSTANAHDAAIGLRRVRRFRQYTYPMRWVWYVIDDITHSIENVLVKLCKTLGILSPTYRPRNIGLRWAVSPMNNRQNRVDPARAFSLATPGPVRRRADSEIPLVSFSSASEDHANQSPPSTAWSEHYRSPSDAGSGGSPSEVRRGLLAPDGHQRPSYERQSSSNAPSMQSFDRSISPSHRISEV